MDQACGAGYEEEDDDPIEQVENNDDALNEFHDAVQETISSHEASIPPT